MHNWWGNGVFVDYPTGNWSEGLTAYLADHLIQEQRGTAVEYRRATLQKYADYVAEEKDFPLTAFRSRHGSVTEAVGYGKTLMFFHEIDELPPDRAVWLFGWENRFQPKIIGSSDRLQYILHRHRVADRKNGTGT